MDQIANDVHLRRDIGIYLSRLIELSHEVSEWPGDDYTMAFREHTLQTLKDCAAEKIWECIQHWQEQASPENVKLVTPKG